MPETLASTGKQSVACSDSLQNYRAGLLYALSAYSIWGIFPLYFRAVAHVPPMLVLCHRIIWSAVFMGLIVSVRGEWKSIRPVIRSPRSLWLLAAGAMLIALNWLIFIYAVGSGQTMQASMGYFINPLLSIGLGMIFMRERLGQWQWCAVAVAAAAVANLAWRGAGFPWIAVSLAFSFGFYGLARKTVNINSLHALLVESVLLLPLALIGLVLLSSKSHASAATHTALSSGTLFVLSLSGVLTAIPLLLFGGALRRLQLSMIGFLQYIGPTLQFLVALCIFREPLDNAKLTSFILCWAAIGVYVADSVFNRRPQPVADEPE